MYIENVQQQNRGDDCGLFAIAFATLLCLNKEPAQAVVDQSIIRRELVKSFEERNIKGYVNTVETIDKQKKPIILYEVSSEFT